MGSRLDLHADLVGIMDGGEVYFQPPSSIKMSYPCIVYKRQRTDTKHANNKPYKLARLYQITLIDDTPDSTFVDILSLMSGVRHTNSFSKDQLSHDVFSLFY